MHVYELDIPARKGLTNIELEKYASELKIPHFRGVYMKDTLPTRPPQKTECGIVNMNKMSQAGSHWVCYAKFPHSVSIYFDSFGQNVLEEVKRYLKTEREFKNNLPVIARNTDVVQRINTHVCGHLCLFVLTSMMREHLPYQHVLNILRYGFTQAYW